MAIFGPFIALDPTQAPTVAKGAAGKAYAVGDEAFLTPLPMTDLSGLPLTDALSDATGLVQAFQVAGHAEIVWVSGGYKVPRGSFQGVQDVAETSAASSAESATAAGLAQQAAETAQQTVEDLLAGGGGGGVSSHSLLSNLGADDHPQYFNQQRGDARYYQKGQVDQAITQANVASSAADRDRTNHTGTQAITTVNGLSSALGARLRVVTVSTGNEARPTDSAVVLWVGGTVQPANMGAVDLWLSDAEVDPGGDASAPSVPDGLAVSALTSTSATITWSPAADNVGVTGYEVFVNGISVATPTAATANLTLVAETAYSVTVRARDAIPNWSAQSAPVEFTTPPTVLPDLHSIFASASVDALSVITDTTPIVATSFYTFSTAANGWRCRGGRVYIPAGVTPPPSLQVSAWTGTDPDLSTTPVATANIAAPVIGWNEVLFPVPFEMTPSQPVWIGYQFSDGRYLTRPIPDTFIQSATTEFLYLSALSDWPGGRSRMRLGSSQFGSNAHFGGDILVDEGA